MQIVLGIIVGLFVLAVLVVIHEAGHAIVAMKNKVVVEEFAIGFPPTVWSKKLKNGILLKVNTLPLGGYVKLQGEHDAADKKGDYGNASFWQKTKILFAGVTFNFITACIILSILAVFGLPKIMENQFYLKNDGKIENSAVFINYVTANSPADRAGLKLDDKILTINNAKITNPEEVRKITKENSDQTVRFVYEREQQIIETDIKINNSEQAKTEGFLGVVPAQSSRIYATWSAPIVGVGTAVQFAEFTVRGIGDLAIKFFGGLISKVSFNAETRQAANESLSSAGEMVAGPIGILGVMFPALLSSSITDFLFFVAIISLTLAVMNILPIPALDGGRWVVMTLFKIFKHPLSKETESKIHASGMVFLLALTVIITVSDVFKLF